MGIMDVALKIGTKAVKKTVKKGYFAAKQTMNQGSSSSSETTASFPGDSDSLGEQASRSQDLGSPTRRTPPLGEVRPKCHVVRGSNGSREALLVAEAHDHGNVYLDEIDRELKLIQVVPEYPLPSDKPYETYWGTKNAFIAHLNRVYNVDHSSPESEIISSKVLKVIKDICTAYMKQKQCQFWIRMGFDDVLARLYMVASAFKTEIVHIVLGILGLGG